VRRTEEFVHVNETWKRALKDFSLLDGKVLVSDFRERFTGEHGNRFLPFAMWPECNVWVKVFDHPNDASRVQISVGHSIFNQTCDVPVGPLMARFGGGGHKGAGTCRPLKTEAGEALEAIMRELKIAD
jgi:hypothetical protein